MTVESSPRTGEAEAPGIAALGTIPVACVAGLAALCVLLRAGRYDFFGDELYFLAAGHHLGLTYADQGPVIPALARLADTVAPGSLTVLRLPAIMAAVGGVLIAVAIARELGGTRRAQVLAGIGYATSPFFASQAASLSTFALDSTLAAIIVWLLVRWTRTRRDRLLLAAGVVAAVDMQIKWIVPVLLAGLALGILLSGPRAMLRRPALGMAALLLFLGALPGLSWQAGHGWPQLAMGEVIRAEQHSATGGAAGLLVQILLYAGVIGVVLIGCALWALLRDVSSRQYRFVALAFLVQLSFVLISGTRPYYVAGLFPGLFAIGAVWLSAKEFHRWYRAIGTIAMLVSTVVAVGTVYVLPLPQSSLRAASDSPGEVFARMRMYGMSGWRPLVDTVDAAYGGLTPDERAQTVMITQTYWQASALDRLWDRAGQRVYSPNRGFGYFGTPPEYATTILYVARIDAETELRLLFSSVERLAALDDPLGFPGVDRGVAVWRCDGPHNPWTAMWPHLMTLAIDSGL